MFSKIFSSSDSMSLMSHLSHLSCCWSQPWNIHQRCNTTAEWLGSYKLQPRSWYTCHCQGCHGVGCYVEFGNAEIWPKKLQVTKVLEHVKIAEKNIQAYPRVDTNMKIPAINQLKTQHNWAMLFVSQCWPKLQPFQIATFQAINFSHASLKGNSWDLPKDLPGQWRKLVCQLGCVVSFYET